MYSLISNFAASSSGLGALGVDGKAFIIQLVTFVLAFLVLMRYAFKPIIKILRERQQVIENGVNLGELMEKEKEKLKSEVDKTLHDSRIKADEIIRSAQGAAKDTISEAENKAKMKADQIIESSKTRIDQETNIARTRLEKELVGLVADATEVVVRQKVDTKTDRVLIEQALKEQRI